MAKKKAKDEIKAQEPAKSSMAKLETKPVAMALSYENQQALGELSKGETAPSKTAHVRNLIPSLDEALALRAFWSKKEYPSEYATDALHYCFMLALEKEMVEDDEYPIGLQLAARKLGKSPWQLVNTVCSLYYDWARVKYGYGRFDQAIKVELQGTDYWTVRHLKVGKDNDKRYEDELLRMEQVLCALKGGAGTGTEKNTF